MFELAGKVVLVTGASSGLGRAISTACAEMGARLVLLARDHDRLAQTRQACPGDGHIVRHADLADLDAIPSLVGDIVREAGPLAGLVHSAGLHQAKPLRMLKADDMISLYSVNAAAAAMLVKGLALRGNHVPGASAVLVSSILGRVGQPGNVAYCMSKGAVELAARAMALELAPQGIRVNCVAPAMIETEMLTKIQDRLGPQQLDASRRQHPLGFGRPEDVARAVVYLLSDAARYVTGTSLLLDGGYCAQ